MKEKILVVSGGGLAISPTDVDKINELKEKINKYDTQYYENGVSEISDAEYDRLYDEYLALEEKNPSIASLIDAPTKKVGAGDKSGTTSGLPKFTHKSPLLSIDKKGKTMEELKKWYDSLGETVEVIVEPKLDGITCNVNYEDGKLVNAVTRGNGYIGDEITENFKATDTMYPNEISGETTMEIRGEAIIPYDFFKKNLAEEYSNPRNAVAGIMRQLDFSEVKGKGVQVMFYDYGLTGNQILSTNDYSDVRSMKHIFGFQNVPIYRCTSWESLKHVVETRMDNLIQEIDGFNVLVDEDGLYPQAVCDGLVIKVNNRYKREEIGFSEKGPKWAFAFKFKPLQAITRIDHVEWQVGKSGRVTPVAIFKEISLGGTNITRATLNNYDYMKTLPVLCESRDIWINESYDNWGSREDIYYNQPLDTDRMIVIRTGDLLMDASNKGKAEPCYIHVEKISDKLDVLYDTSGKSYPIEKDRYCLVNQNPGLQMDDLIVVERSNDVIPRIIAIQKHQNCIYQQDIETTKRVAERMNSFKAPSSCPVCGQPLSNQYPLLYCTHSLCAAQITGKIEHFASRDAMNIGGLGEGVVNALYEEGLLTTIPSIYHLKNYSDKMNNLHLFGIRKIEKLLSAIEESKTPELWQFIYALSIEGIGKRASKDLAQRYHTLDNFLNATEKEFLDMDDVGVITGNTLIRFITDENIKKMIQELIEVGVKPRAIEIEGDKFKGKTFIITGTLEHPRKYYQDIIEKNGGKVSGSVSKKTSAVLIGSDAGSKEEKARALVSKGEEILILDTEEMITEFLGI